MALKEFDNLVTEERIRQDMKWGVQNHAPNNWVCILTEEVGDLSAEVLGYHFEPEMQKSNDDIEKELIQVVAVCKAMWECGKRNGWIK